MPILRPFRALRYALSGRDLSSVVCPPYDVITPAEREGLLARDPMNAVRIELPGEVGRAEEADYRAAARTLAQWRTDGVLVKDRQPTLTVHRMTWEREGQARACTGVLARIRLEPFGPGAGVRPHERTMAAPKEDRYRLLRATGLHLSPIVVLGDDDASASRLLTDLSAGAPAAEARTPDGVRHELWIHQLTGPSVAGAGPTATPSAADPPADPAALLGRLGAEPVTIADGHHRYETALRYREERGRNRACESDPPWDYALVLVYPLGDAPEAMPTHRVMLEGPRGRTLLTALAELFEVTELPDAEALLARMSEPPKRSEGTTGSGRIGLASDGRWALLRARRSEVASALPVGLSDASRGLDVNALGAAVERLYGRDQGALAEAGRVVYVKDARDAVAAVQAGRAAACFLLDPVPPAAIVGVAAAGEVMPEKSTYFFPKAPTGLLFSPLEW